LLTASDHDSERYDLRGRWRHVLAQQYSGLNMQLPAFSLVGRVSVTAHPAAALTPSGDDLIQTDGLGYACVADADLEAFWESGGKSSRAPQTCIEDPCALLLGRPASNPEFFPYRNQMTQTCGATPLLFMFWATARRTVHHQAKLTKCN
jgi:hypothetical protein